MLDFNNIPIQDRAVYLTSRGFWFIRFTKLTEHFDKLAVACKLFAVHLDDFSASP